MAELADAAALGAAGATLGGSNPLPPIVFARWVEVLRPRVKVRGGSALRLWVPGRKLLSRPSNELWSRVQCGSSSVVEHHVANVRVAGSNPVSRSIVAKGGVTPPFFFAGAEEHGELA